MTSQPIGTTPCPWPDLEHRCARPVIGVDPCRVCERCQAAGAPAWVDYSVVTGRDCTPQVIALANAGLVDAPKADVGSFARTK